MFPGDDLVENLSGFWKIDPEAFPAGLRETVRSFVELLHSFSLKDISQTPDSLREAMTRSGLFLEHKMRQWIEGEPNETVASLVKGDLKGHLLKLRPELNPAAAALGSQDSGVHGGDRLTVEQLGKGVEQLIQKLELVQLLNARPIGSPGKDLHVSPGVVRKPAPLSRFKHLIAPARFKGARHRRAALFSSCSICRNGGGLRIEVNMRGKNLYVPVQGRRTRRCRNSLIRSCRI